METCKICGLKAPNHKMSCYSYMREEIKTIKQIDVQDWDRLVSDTYNKPYFFQQQDGCKSRGVEIIDSREDHAKDFENTTLPFIVNGDEMGVAFETWLTTNPEDTKKHFKNDGFSNDLFWDRNFYPHVSMILIDLCNKKLMEPGQYQIKIDW